PAASASGSSGRSMVSARAPCTTLRSRSSSASDSGLVLRAARRRGDELGHALDLSLGELASERGHLALSLGDALDDLVHARSPLVEVGADRAVRARGFERVA